MELCMKPSTPPFQVSLRTKSNSNTGYYQLLGIIYSPTEKLFSETSKFASKKHLTKLTTYIYIPKYLLNIIKYFLTRSCFVSFDFFNSLPFNPLLLICIRHPIDPSCNLSQFVDDLATSATNTRKTRFILQKYIEYLEILNSCCLKWGLSLNKIKTHQASMQTKEQSQCMYRYHQFFKIK